MDETRLFISVNGGDIVPVDAIRVFIKGGLDIEESAECSGAKDCSVQYNFTDEGVIMDLIDDDEIVSGTFSQTYHEIATVLFTDG